VCQSFQHVSRLLALVQVACCGGSLDVSASTPPTQVSLLVIARQWSRLGCIGFGGPPTHITLLRKLCVDENEWMDADEFEDAIATTNLLPGPASTQLAIYCAWRLRGRLGGLIGGLCFIIPGLVIILALSSVYLAHHPMTWILGATAGAGAAVSAVALSAAWRLIPASWMRRARGQGATARWVIYAMIGAVTSAVAAEYLVLALIACGALEVVLRRRPRQSPALIMAGTAAHLTAAGGLGALTWVALKVGALSYGGGFVIVPLMQHDVVTTYHWMSATQFLGAVALGQLTPGPVVQTVAVVGYAAAGVGGGLLAAAVAFTPSFLFVLAGASRFDALRTNATVRSFFAGAGPAVIGAIAGSAIPLGLALQFTWQIPILAGAILWLFVLRRGVVSVFVLAALTGTALALAGVHV
jgi:chromate transporter